MHGAAGSPLVAQTPAAACALADDLARLIDDMTMRGVPWQRLDQLVPDELDKYWQLTLQFLQIASHQWPAILDERGVIEATTRRDLLIKAESERLARGSHAPVIAAGSTGSIPATAALIATIASLPHGAVVLPGLDTDLDAAAWDLIGGREAEDDALTAPASGHPQFAMQALLQRLHLDRKSLHPAREISERHQGMNGNCQPDNRCAERLTYARGNPAEIGGRHGAGSDISKNFHQACHRTKQTEQRSDSNDDLQDKQPAFHAYDLLAGP